MPMMSGILVQGPINVPTDCDCPRRSRRQCIDSLIERAMDRTNDPGMDDMFKNDQLQICTMAAESSKDLTASPFPE